MGWLEKILSRIAMSPFLAKYREKTMAEFDVNSQNPVINTAGEATIDPSQFATWNTANGSASSLTITNPGQANTVTIVISGAPSTIVEVNTGKPLNGVWNLRPNTPTDNVTALGDFTGAQVYILNNTNPNITASAHIVCRVNQ